MSIRPSHVDLLEPALSSEFDLCPYPQMPTELSEWERLTLKGGRELDRALRWLSKKFTGFSLDQTALDTTPGEVAAALEYYGSEHFTEKPSRFFHKPKSPAQVCLSVPHEVLDGEVRDLIFRSHYQPSNKVFRKEHYRHTENRIAHARLWMHAPGKSLGRVFAIHGWFMGDQRINALTLVPGFFYRLGLDVVLYELPYHGRRAPEENGKKAMFPGVNLARTNEAIGQAIYDLRALSQWLHAEAPLPIGVVGMSLGGYIASLWASLDKLAFVVPMLPLVSMSEVAWSLLHEWRMRDPFVLQTHVPENLSQEDLERAYRLHSPLHMQPKTVQSRQMIIAANDDAVIPHSQPEALWNHWGQPKIHWFSGGHFGDMAQGSVLSEVHQFLLSLKLAYKDPLPLE